MNAAVLLADQTSALMFAGGLCLAALILLRRVLRMTRKRRKKPSPHVQATDFRKSLDRRAPKTDRPLLDAPAELGRWHVELMQVARDIQAEVDTRIGLLQATIRSASREAERLEAAVLAAKNLPGHEGAESATLTQIRNLTREIGDSVTAPTGSASVNASPSGADR